MRALEGARAVALLHLSTSLLPLLPLSRPHPSSIIQTGADADREFRNMLARRRQREMTMFAKAHELREHNCEVFLVVHHYDDDRYVVYNSEPVSEWPPFYEMIVSTPPHSTSISALVPGRPAC